MVLTGSLPPRGEYWKHLLKVAKWLPKIFFLCRSVKKIRLLKQCMEQLVKCKFVYINVCICTFVYTLLHVKHVTTVTHVTIVTCLTIVTHDTIVTHVTTVTHVKNLHMSQLSHIL